MWIKRMPVLILAALILGLTIAMMTQQTGEPVTADLALPLEAGKPPVKLSAMHGKVVVLDFWATWCGPCRMSMPELEKVYQKYKDKGVQVIGISENDPAQRADIDPARKAIGVTYPDILAADVPGLMPAFGHEGIPYLVLLDKEGKKAYEFEGYDPQNKFQELDDKLAALLKQ